MARRPDASKQRRWLDLMRLWQQSRLTVRAFCQRHRLTEPNFYAWRQLLRQRGLLSEQPAPQSSAKAASTPAAFVQLTVQAEPPTVAAVDLVLNERRLLRIRPGFDAATLLELVRLLEEPA